MKILAFEGTAHTISVASIEINDKGFRVIAHEKHSYSSKDKGMVPAELGEHHLTHIKTLTQQVLKSVPIKEIDLVAYSAGPGIGNGLQIVALFAKTLALKHNKPLMPIHHGAAHALIAKHYHKLENELYIYVSGGNTQILILKNKKFYVLGETEDIAIGNALDKLARELGFGFPGGPIIEKLAKSGKYIDLPYVVKGMDLSFSGLLTKAIQLKSKHSAEDIAFSFQEHAFAMITETAERALAYENKNQIVVVGGVALNNRLQEMVKIMAQERGAEFFEIPKEYLGDNAIMIGVAAHYYMKYSLTPTYNFPIKTKWRIEQAFEINV